VRGLFARACPHALQSMFGRLASDGEIGVDRAAGVRIRSVSQHQIRVPRIAGPVKDGRHRRLQSVARDRAAKLERSGVPAALQPQHSLAQPESRSGGHILFPKVDPSNGMGRFRSLLCIVELSQLVFLSPPAARTLYGKLSWQARRA
jgi:hypothetical protein